MSKLFNFNAYLRMHVANFQIMESSFFNIINKFDQNQRHI